MAHVMRPDKGGGTPCKGGVVLMSVGCIQCIRGLWVSRGGVVET